MLLGLMSDVSKFILNTIAHQSQYNCVAINSRNVDKHPEPPQADRLSPTSTNTKSGILPLS
ncbi:MAG: hypothetical protein J6J57_05450 [Alistipes sp.]|nr:hypothetical protein [Alistipes sp.]